jgi:hypothetical protein
MNRTLPPLTAEEQEQTRFLLRNTDPFGRLATMAAMLVWLGPDHMRRMHLIRDRFEMAEQRLTPPPPTGR